MNLSIMLPCAQHVTLGVKGCYQREKEYRFGKGPVRFGKGSVRFGKGCIADGSTFICAGMAAMCVWWSY